MISVEFIWVRSKFLCAIKKIIHCLADVVALSRIFVMPCKSIYFTKGSVRACSAHCWLSYIVDPRKFEFGVRFDSWIHIWSLVAPCSVWHLLELNTCALERQKLSSKVIELMFLSMFRYATLIYLLTFFVYVGKDIPSAAHVRKSILHGAADHVLRKVWVYSYIHMLYPLKFSPFPHHQFMYSFRNLNSPLNYLTRKQREKTEKMKMHTLTWYLSTPFCSELTTWYLCPPRFCIGQKRKIKWKKWRHVL